MSDNWNFYFRTVDDLPASIYVDLGIAGDLPSKTYPNMGYLRLAMKRPRPDGLASEREIELLHSLELALIKAVEGRDWSIFDDRKQTIFVGRNTCGGWRDFYFYTNSSVFEDDLRAAMGKWPHYQFETGVQPDPSWSVYRDFLYPEPEDFHRMANRDHLAKLLELGDRTDVARPIDHFVYFKTEADRSLFMQYLLDNNFEVGQLTSRSDDDFSVNFHRTDRPDDMDNVAIDLFGASQRFNGNYDGWGCAVEK